jgi:hypothetical protein
MNNISFEDRERTLEEIKSLFFKTLNLWTVAYVSPLTISYSDLFVLFTFSSYMLPHVTCILPVYLVAPYTFNYICRLLIKK